MFGQYLLELADAVMPIADRQLPTAQLDLPTTTIGASLGCRGRIDRSADMASIPEIL